MGLPQRVALYKKLEGKRKRPLIVYVTSPRPQAEAQIANDSISELIAQLQALPSGANELDFYLVSNGGDPSVAWRIVSLIRERVDKFSVLVPQAAFSAATLIVLGANEIVMHPYGNLGPTDPQIINRSKNLQFGSQDLAAFLTFAKEEVGLTDQAPLLELFKKFSEEVSFVGIGVAARGSQLAARMAEKLLRLHMTSDDLLQKVKAIAGALNTKFFHHGYPVSKSEAKELGLPIAKDDTEIEELLWKIWMDIEGELILRQPFSPVAVLHGDPNCASLFAPVPPGGGPVISPPVKFVNTTVIMESCRHVTHHTMEGEVSAIKTPDQKLNVSLTPIRSGWQDVPLPSDKATGKPSAKKSKLPKPPKTA